MIRTKIYILRKNCFEDMFFFGIYYIRSILYTNCGTFFFRAYSTAIYFSVYPQNFTYMLTNSQIALPILIIEKWSRIFIMVEIFINWWLNTRFKSFIDRPNYTSVLFYQFCIYRIFIVRKYTRKHILYVINRYW